MQRWIAPGIVAFLLCVGAGYFGLKTYRDGRPHPIWVPIPINVELGKEQRDLACSHLKAYVLEKPRLAAISRDLKLADSWSLPNEDAAMAELEKRIFIRPGRANSPMGEIPALHVGLKGTRKEKELTQKIVLRMMDDVNTALGRPDTE